jgi:MFS transporter, YQGE family, putative transporter
MNNNISSPKTIRLIIAHNIVIFGRAVFDIFFTIFLWSSTDSLSIVAIFMIGRISAHTFGFTIFAWLVKKGISHITRSISLLLFIFSYLTIFLLGENVIDYLIPVSLSVGLASGIYWLSYLVTQFDLTNPSNRGNYNGINIASKTLALLLAPIVGGAAIHFNFFGFGYGNIFLIGAFSYLISLVIGYIKIEGKKHPPLHFIKTLKEIKKKKDIINLMIARFFGNFGYKGTMERLLPVFIFSNINSELQLGWLMSLFSVTAIITTFIVGKFISYKKYSSLITLGGSLFFISTMSLVGLPNIITYILYGFSREILVPLFEIPIKVHRDNLLHQIPNYKQHRVEYIVIREWTYVFFSRVLSYGLLFFVDDLSSGAMQIILAIMASSILLETLIIRKIKFRSPGEYVEELDTTKI